MAAEGEEVVVGADPRQSEDLGEDPAQQFLARPAGVPAGRAPARLRRGQRPAVDLAVGGEGERVEGDEGGGHHVGSVSYTHL